MFFSGFGQNRNFSRFNNQMQNTRESLPSQNWNGAQGFQQMGNGWSRANNFYQNNQQIGSPLSPRTRSPFHSGSFTGSFRGASSPGRENGMRAYMTPPGSPTLNNNRGFNRFSSPFGGFQNRKVVSSRELMAPGKVRYASPGQRIISPNTSQRSIFTQPNQWIQNSRNELVQQININKAGSPFKNGFSKFHKNNGQVNPQRFAKKDFVQDPSFIANRAFQTQKRIAQNTKDLNLQTIPPNFQNNPPNSQFINVQQFYSYNGNYNPYQQNPNQQPPQRQERVSNEVIQIQKYRSGSKESQDNSVHLIEGEEQKKTIESLEEYNDVCNKLSNDFPSK